MRAAFAILLAWSGRIVTSLESAHLEPVVLLTLGSRWNRVQHQDGKLFRRGNIVFGTVVHRVIAHFGERFQVVRL